MKVIDFNGQISSWPPAGHIINLDDSRPRSQYHIKCRKLLREIFPLDIIMEEVPIPGLRLFLDFYTPHNKTAYEVNGEQHYSYNDYFFSNKIAFVKAQNNDKKKKAWCELNNIGLIILSYKDEKIWKDMVLKNDVD